MTEVILDRTSFADGVQWLATRDNHLAGVLNHLGTPPMWIRRPGFTTLVRIILEQQVSLASANATYQRLRGRVPRFTPRNLLSLPPRDWRAAGVTRQKTEYCRNLARAIVARDLDLRALTTMDDARASHALMELKGIGQWTADIYLLMALRRTDVFPVGDLAIVTATHRLLSLRRRPTPERMISIGTRWKPWRAVATRILWHYYLGGLPDLKP